ncbi:MAG: Uma2 family endonuclease [Sporichthyaceae bacterium]
MRVVILEAPQSMLDERRRLGLDKRDEMWDGELHMVPPPRDAHQGMSRDFYDAVAPLARAVGLVVRWETGLFRHDSDYRVPDLQFRRPEHGSERGSEGAELVVEVRSPKDETYQKLPFYAAVGVREMLVLHPEPRTAELYRLEEGVLRPVDQDEDGALHCVVLDVTLRAADGVLRLAWSGGSAEL